MNLVQFVDQYSGLVWIAIQFVITMRTMTTL